MALTVAAYLLIAALVGVWFWRLIRSTGHPINAALILVSVAFALPWPLLMPGVVGYRWLQAQGMVQ